jgi:adenylosuccinate synthase
VASRYTARANGLTAVALTRLDVLDRFPTVRICTAYRIDGRVTDVFPASTRELWEAEPVYEEMPGWEQDTSGIRRFQDLPAAAQAYVRRIEELLEVPIYLVSVGPEREQAIVLGDIW